MLYPNYLTFLYLLSWSIFLLKYIHKSFFLKIIIFFKLKYNYLLSLFYNGNKFNLNNKAFVLKIILKFQFQFYLLIVFFFFFFFSFFFFFFFFFFYFLLLLLLKKMKLKKYLNKIFNLLSEGYIK